MAITDTRSEPDLSVGSWCRTSFQYLVLVCAVFLGAKTYVSNCPLRSEIADLLTPESAGKPHSSLDEKVGEYIQFDEGNLLQVFPTVIDFLLLRYQV